MEKKVRLFTFSIYFIIYLLISVYMHFSILVNINLHGTCMPSPSPKFTGFSVTTILHELSSSALRKQNIVFANLPNFPSGKCPTILFYFLTQTTYLSIGLSGSLSHNKNSPIKGFHNVLCTWYPFTYDTKSKFHVTITLILF